MAFFRTNIVSTISPEADPEHQIRLNFNISLLNLKCDFVTVDVKDALGANRQNVTKNIQRWQLNAEGKRGTYAGRQWEGRELKHDEHDETLEEMIKDGSYAHPLKLGDWDQFTKKREMVFVDFFAPWCGHCKRLAPTWEKFAQRVFEDGMPVGVATVDCTIETELCGRYKITGFPTMQWFVNGEVSGAKYSSDRTVDALTAFAQQKIKTNERYKEWEADPKRKDRYKNFDPNGLKNQNPGCQISGHLMVNRVPGNFHIEAKAKDHSIDPTMTNLTLVVHSLSFGKAFNNREWSNLVDDIMYSVPEEHKRFGPFDGKTFSTDQAHQAFHHYIKVIPTVVDIGHPIPVTVYQILGQSQVVFYDAVNVPEARFSYDLSPMTVTLTSEGRRWYDYLTSLCAIVGGAYTTLGLIDAVLFKMLKPKKL
eukprot:CAMPEP_0183330326 /NCGR_PEP_ID=MMETSP0160_2-20130417/85244_1 /TAXON_ID=2839 ORGANISM="Odontella Sinensis, Strain Grunow 1884" /NCGR_SAMPLE_ID=MMETSP0160_2 /ASSEMBLY_ACC=CAM_ASM_000250 /LENGTH=421 /DNA_ID=CAMNT_0025498531 /DNA_START=289 /DNA_END=1554 /DNA_ORIENTATION=-